jgi:hypothetical protein
MVESLLDPALFAMAGIALLAELSIVGIIGFMAIEASRRCLAIFLVLLGMTEAARQAGVGALEYEIGLTVIKGFTIQINDIPFPALVFGVTALTVIGFLRFEPAVIPRALFDVLGDVAMIVTRETAINLFGFFQCLMTAFALFLKLGMPGYHRTRHENEI